MVADRVTLEVGKKGKGWLGLVRGKVPENLLPERKAFSWYEILVLGVTLAKGRKKSSSDLPVSKNLFL